MHLSRDAHATNHRTEVAIRRGRGRAPDVGAGLASGARRPTCSPDRPCQTVNTLTPVPVTGAAGSICCPGDSGHSCCRGPERQQARAVPRPREEPGPGGTLSPARPRHGCDGVKRAQRAAVASLARRRGLGGATGSQTSARPRGAPLALPRRLLPTQTPSVLLFGLRRSGILGTWKERWFS